MKVKTDYSESTYITAGKVYDVSFDYSGCPFITDDCGDEINIDDGDSGCPHLRGSLWRVVDEKPFSISNHEWGDTVGYVEHGADEISLNCGTGENYIELFKDDAIAIAKHFKLTVEDLNNGKR